MRQAVERTRGISDHELNIAFTCAGRRVVLLELFRRAMGELNVSGKLIAVDQTDAAATMHVADVAVRVPPTGTLHYIRALKDLCAEHRIGLLIPLTDLDVRSLARHRDTFADAGTEVMIGSSDAVMICREKSHTSDFFQRIGLPGIRTMALENFRARPFFPCFIKPIRSSASVGASVLRSEADLNAHLATFGELMLVQDYVQGAEFTLDIFRTRSGEVKCVVPRQRLSIRCGEVEKGLTVNDPVLIEAGVLIGEGLKDIWGVINAQCRRQPGQPPRFFEINPRFGGGVPLAVAAGANLPLYVLQERLGLEVTAELGRFKPNLLMMRHDQAVFTEVESPQDLPGFETPEVR